MAKYTGSIFGEISGEQLGVVGSKWKGVPYVRRYVVPANPDTAAQQAQRSKFKNVSEFGRRIVNTVLNTYTLPLPKKMSAFNLFVSRNVKLQTTSTLDYSLLKIVQGTLYNPGISSLNGSAASTNVDVGWDDTLIGEALATDPAEAVIYIEELDMFFYAANAERSHTLVSVPCAGMTAGDNIHCWLYFVATAETFTSDSEYDTAVCGA